MVEEKLNFYSEEVISEPENDAFSDENTELPKKNSIVTGTSGFQSQK